MTKEEFEMAGALARNLSIVDELSAKAIDKLDIFDKMAELLLKSNGNISPLVYDNLAKDIVHDYEDAQFNNIATDYFGE